MICTVRTVLYITVKYSMPDLLKLIKRMFFFGLDNKHRYSYMSFYEIYDVFMYGMGLVINVTGQFLGEPG